MRNSHANVNVAKWPLLIKTQVSERLLKFYQHYLCVDQSDRKKDLQSLLLDNTCRGLLETSNTSRLSHQ